MPPELTRYTIPATTIDGPERKAGDIVEFRLVGRLVEEAGALTLRVSDFAGPVEPESDDHLFPFAPPKEAGTG